MKGHFPMKLIFIRHAEPDYSIDSLTVKGSREAKLLARRTRDWNVTQFCCSPLGRAQATAKPTLDAAHVSLTDAFPAEAADTIHPLDASKAIVYPWLREVHAPVDKTLHPAGKTIAWDLTPEYLDQNAMLLDPVRWTEAPLLSDGALKEQYDWISNRLDTVLALHGYTRNGVYYQTSGEAKPSDWFMQYNGTTLNCLANAMNDSAVAQEPCVVIFCHLGVMLTMISHLINTSPFQLYQGCFIPPASVTVLSTEERIPGDAYFRIQMLGDTSHLRSEGEPISYYGGFAAPFQL